jgi:hypothetical protein
LEVQKIAEKVNRLHFDALEFCAGLDPTASNIAKASQRFGPEVASWAFTQQRLKKLGKRKFAKAKEMLFTRAGLEQATHEQISKLRATRFPKDVPMADFCCGIGGDLIALSLRGETVGFEIDPQTAAYAEHNVHVHGSNCKVIIEDGLSNAGLYEYAFADPSRRSKSKRLVDPNDFSPNPFALGEYMQTMKLGAIKLSPMLEDGQLDKLSKEIQFISFEGECREAVAWIGEESTAASYATHIESGEHLMQGAVSSKSNAPDEYFYEADSAAIRAHCLGTLCDRYGLTALGDSNGYLTGGHQIVSPWLRGYRIVETGNFDRKRLRSLLKSKGGGRPFVKTRSKSVPQTVEKELTTPGEMQQTIAIYPVGKSLKFVLLDVLCQTEK